MHQHPHKLTSVHTWDRGWTDVLSHLHFSSFLLLFSFLLFFVVVCFFGNETLVKSKQMFFCCSLIWTACFVWLTLYIIYNIWGYTIIFQSTKSCEWIQNLPDSSDAVSDDDLVHVTVKKLKVCRCVCRLTWVDAAAGVICVEIWSALITQTRSMNCYPK